MAEGEQDYMGDVSQFLPPEICESSTKKGLSSKPIMSNSCKKKSKVQKWQEQRKLKRGWIQIDEDQQTMEKLGLSIPESNIGFKLLKQMGYTPGTALGKEGSGISEPVGLEIRRGRAGIGKEDPKMEKIKREKQKFEIRNRKEEELMENFGSRQKDRWKGRRIILNHQKAENVLAQLEGRDVELEKKGDEDEKYEDEEEEEITEQYESMEALMTDCPGINEDEH